jgi:hypothetical protein
MGVGGSVYMHKEQEISQNSLIVELHNKIHKEELARAAEFSLLRKVTLYFIFPPNFIKEVSYIREKMETLTSAKPSKSTKNVQGGS